MRQGLRLEPLLQAIYDFLDDQKDMIEQVRCDLTRGLKKAGTGRSGLTPQQILRSLVLMRIKNWDYRELPGRLSDTVERIAEPKESEERPHTAQIFFADLQHGRILAEQSNPLLRKGSRGQSDQFSQGEGHRYADPGRLYGSLYLTGAKVRADHDPNRTADAVG